MSRRPFFHLAALLLALWPAAARAAVVGAAPLYPAVSAPWSGAIAGALQTSPGAVPLAPGLTPLTSPALPPGAGYAPVVAQLESALKLTPAAFAALPAPQRQTALELAVEAAQADLGQKTWELAARAKALSAPDKALDKDGRAELYRVVAQLDELRTRYGPLLSAEETAAATDAYGRASARAWDIRNALLRRDMKDVGAALAGAGRDEPAPVQVAPEPGRAARELADAMRNNAVGWKLRDLDHLLIGYGYTLDQGGKHRKYEFPGMKPQIVPRHTEVDPNYVKSALEAIDRLASRRAPAPDGAAPAGAAPPARIDLADLAVLLAEPAKKPAAVPARKPAVAPARKPAAAKAAVPPRAPAAVKLAPAEPRVQPRAEPVPPSPAAPAPGALERLRAWLKNSFTPRP
jgi:hypothetical protein